MKKRVPWYVALLVVLIVIGVSAFVYSRLPIVPTVPPQPKGSNRPPPGTHEHKIAGDKAAASKRSEAPPAKPDGADAKQESKDAPAAKKGD
jgi:hypothetical protein